MLFWSGWLGCLLYVKAFSHATPTGFRSFLNRRFYKHFTPSGVGAMTKNRRTSKANWAVAIFVAAYCLTIAPARAQLDETCKVMINNQTVQVGFGGEFRISNIPAGNNLLRIHAICTKGGKTRYGRSTFYQVRGRETVVLSELDFVWRDAPFPTTAAILVVADNAILNEIGATTQIRVTATFSDSTKKNVTSRGFGSTYTSTNPSVASVDLQGRVTANGVGTAFITVNNEGATAVTRITVAPSNLLTTVEGIVQLENGSPAVGTTVVVPGFGETVVTDPDGKFSFSGIYAPFGSLKARAYSIINNQLLLGITGNLRLIQGGITDAGIIVIKPVTNFVYWKDAVSGAWIDATRWNTGRVPAATDNVFIGVPGNITVTHPPGTTTTIKSLFCDESFTLSGDPFFSSSFAISDSSEMTRIFTFSAGTLAGNGILTIFGTLTWSGGTMATGGSMNIAASGLMDLSGATAKTSNRMINNFGTTTVSGGGTFSISSGSSFNNQVGGIFAIGSDGNILGSTGSLNNMGTVRKTGATGITSFGARFNNNNGTIDMLTGTLNLVSGGASTSGIFTVAAGASLFFNGGTHVFSGTFSGTGAGITQLTGGTIQVNPNGATFNFTGSGFRVNGGILTVPGILNNIATFNWIAGTLRGPGVLTNIGTINISNGGDITFDGGTLNNAGTIVWTGTRHISIANAAVFNNLVNGVFDIQGNANANINGGGVFNNVGTIRKSAGTGTNTISGIRFNNNDGAINVLTGTLSLVGSAGSASTGGNFTIASGATLDLTGNGNNQTYTGSYTGSGEGTICLSCGNFSGTLNIGAAGATFNFSGKVFQWIRGTLKGPGVLTNIGTLNISNPQNIIFDGGTLNNAGTVVWTGAGGISFANAAVFNNLINGVFDIQSNANANILGVGAFNNMGTIRKSAGTGTNTISGIRFNNNDGAINVLTGTLSLAGGAGSINTGGNFTVASGAILDLTNSTNTQTYIGSYTGSGEGTICLSCGNFSGTLNIGAAGATFNFSGRLFQWIRGTLKGPGVLTNIGTLNISNPQNITFDGGMLNNAGTVVWTGAGGISFANAAVFNNLGNGVFDIQGNAVIATGVGAFNNAGTFRKSAGTGTTTISGSTFNNSGTVDMQSGTLAVSNKYTQATSGTLNIRIGGLTAGTQFSRLTVSGSAPAATLNGTLNVNLVNSFVPNIGNTFQIMTFQSRGNTCFDPPINLPPLPAGRRWRVDCTGSPTASGSLTLVVEAGVAEQ